MLDIQKMILMTMKKEIFSTSNEENKAARNVLAEIKTKQKDILTEITNEIQYKILKKLKSDREISIKLYNEQKRDDLSIKERFELSVINNLITIIEEEMPKKLNEDEIKNIIYASEIPFVNIGQIMSLFKDKNVDKALVAKIAKEFLNK